jgi:hypothetical protein
MLRRFLPEHPGACPGSARVSGEAMVSGRVYDVTDEWAAHVEEGCPGIDGAPCLVPVEDIVPESGDAPKPAAGVPAKPARKAGK